LLDRPPLMSIVDFVMVDFPIKNHQSTMISFHSFSQFQIPDATSVANGNPI
jgi:hypothetical protein